VRAIPNYPEETAPRAVRGLRDLPGAERLRADRPLVLYLGALLPGRGIEQLIEAMTAVEADLVLLGEGFHKESVEEKARMLGVGDRVHVLDPVPLDEVVDYAASADVGVSPIVPSCLSYRYSLPNKVFQYMAARLPVVASDFPQIRDVIEGSGAGLVVDTTRPTELAAALRQLLANRERAMEMGERGQAAVAERYNWSVAATDLVDVYRSVIEPVTARAPRPDRALSRARPEG
jgi:glycosyltransferase involved in cell wall biosynthesis